jgi:RNA polymerase sigma-70 factor, ECF subfamily
MNPSLNPPFICSQWSIADMVKQDKVPSFADMEDNTWEFGEMKGFQFSYTLVEFVLTRFGPEAFNQFVRNPFDFEGAFRCSASEVHQMWTQKLIEIVK